MSKRGFGMAVAGAIALGACVAAPGPAGGLPPSVTEPTASPTVATPSPAPISSPAASPLAGGWSAVPVDDARLLAAVDQGIAQLQGAAWLAAPDLAAGTITAGERQVVAGTNHGATLTLTAGGKRRQARIVVFEDLAGAFRVTAIDLGPSGGEAPLLEVPRDAAMPGGWTTQPVDDPGVVTAKDKARNLLGEADWLGRAIVVDRIAAAKTQVVAGLNTYLALDAQVDGFPHRVDVIVYEPLQGAATLSWVRLAEPTPAR